MRLTGHWRHTSAVGDLVTSLYAAGRPEYRSGPDDPAPGVPSITAVMPRLAVKGLDQVVQVNRAEGWVLAQGRCRLDGLRSFLAGQGLALAAVDPAVGAPGRARGRGCETAGAGVIGGVVSAVWADVLTKSGELARHSPDALPPDGFVVAVALRLAS
ncbi:MAG: hypothetical protein LBC97_16635 [Bifidobacteriaceae bacterium]|nr:hypothetical protein [Bifidobacteriaceae bacterium]